MPVSNANGRVATAVSMPAALNNCFFNAYAAHMLSNNLPLPQDLFTPDPTQKGSQAEQLKEVFKNPIDLKMFDDYYRQNHPASKEQSSIVEKTLVLGVLYRAWFTKNMLHNKQNQKKILDVSNGNSPTFLDIARCFANKEEAFLVTLRQDPMYLASSAFFESLYEAKPPLDERRLSQVTTEYWNKKGYKEYCQYLSKPDIPVTASDVECVLQSEKVPYTFYDKKNGQPYATSTEPRDNKPKFEVALQAEEGHYYLIQTTKTQKFLQEFENSMQEYHKEREKLLDKERTPEEIKSECSDKKQMLLAATLPAEVKPFKLMIDRVKTMRTETKKFTEASHKESSVNTKLIIETQNPSHEDVTKARAYQVYMKDYLHNIRGKMQSVTEKIDPKNIDTAEKQAGQTDEEFAAQLQEAEYRKAGLK